MSIKDPRIRVQISQKLLNIIEENQNYISDMPETLYNRLKNMGLTLSATTQIIKDDLKIPSLSLNIKLLRKILADSTDNTDACKHDINCNNTKKLSNYLDGGCLSDMLLDLNELQWLNNFLQKLRTQQNVQNIYLHDVLKPCKVLLPQNEELPRNPELEARCKRLREQQENLEYFKMTKNVNSTLKNHPEDTIAYQLKAINNQVIAVLQFIFSVAAGFFFGFIGIELIIGNMDFGIRLLLGIMFALIIAIAEIYFLAKKLNEYDVIVDNINNLDTQRKLHAD